jgi:hypothetical protein
VVTIYYYHVEGSDFGLISSIIQVISGWTEENVGNAVRLVSVPEGI